MKTSNNIQPAVSTSEIVNYYDQCEIDYRWIWHLSDQNAMHYGYWTDETANLREALFRMNEFVIDRLQIEPGDKVLDAGCGVGGTSRFVAQRYNAEVHGITLSEKQVATAIKNSSGLNLKGQVKFSARDYCNTQFPSSYFNRIYGIESVCHANEKADFLAESYRLLQEGGTLVVADFFATENIKTESDKKLMHNWADTWAVPSFEVDEEFKAKAEKVGFKLVSEENISHNIYRSALRLYRCFFPGIICHSVLRMLFLRNKTQGKNVWSTYYQYKSLKKKLWQYKVYTFKKINN